MHLTDCLLHAIQSVFVMKAKRFRVKTQNFDQTGHEFGDQEKGQEEVITGQDGDVAVLPNSFSTQNLQYQRSESGLRRA